MSNMLIIPAISYVGHHDQVVFIPSDAYYKVVGLNSHLCHLSSASLELWFQIYLKLVLPITATHLPTTTMLNVHVPCIPVKSVAVYVTTVVPTGNESPGL